MKLISKPTLQQMALVKTAIELWNQKTISKLISNYIQSKLNSDFIEEWETIEIQVEQKVYQLPLPELLKRYLWCFIRPIGDQIKAWCSYHHRKQCQILKLPAKFCWTPEGTIDRKRTAELLVNDNEIDVETRYKLACIYCLEGKIPELWKQIPEQQRLKFETEIYNPFAPVHVLVKFWSYRLLGKARALEEIIRKEMGQSHPHHVYAFDCAVEDANKAATEFFFKQMSDEERNTLLVEYAGRAVRTRYYEIKPKEYYTEVFLFLLSHMSEDQQLKVLKENLQSALSSFLYWPYQPFFLVSVDQTMNLITEKDNKEVLELIASKIVNGWTDFDYRQLFQEYWRVIPLSLKRLSTKHLVLLFQLLEHGEEEILKFMFKDADSFAMKELILSDEGRALCEVLVYKSEFSSLVWFIEQCVLSKEVMVEFKKGFMKRNRKRTLPLWCVENRRKWKIFLSLLDKLIGEQSEKRKAEDDDGVWGKKLRVD